MTDETQIRSRFTLAHRKLVLHNRNELVGYTNILVGFLSYILYILIFYIPSLSRDKEYSFETRRNSLRDRRSRKICPNPTKVGIYSVQRSLYLLYPLRCPCRLRRSSRLYCSAFIIKKYARKSQRIHLH